MPNLICRLRAPLAALLLTALTTGCGGGFREERPLDATIDLPADLQRLTIRVPAGPLTVTAGTERKLALEGRTRLWARHEAAFEALRGHDATPRLSKGEADGDYVVEFPWPEQSYSEREAVLIVKSSIVLPPDVELVLETARGALAIVGWQAPVRMRTGSGDVLVQNVTGAADVETGLGKVTFSDHRGDARVRSGGGTVFVDVAEFGPNGLDLLTEDPSMVVYLPPAVGFDFDATVLRSTAGKIGVRNGFGVEAVEVMGVVEETGKSARGHRAQAEVRGGGPLVKLEVGRGYLSCRERNWDK